MNGNFVTSLVVCVALATQASAAPQIFIADLSGAAEEPANASPGTGSTQVTIDPVAHTLRVIANFSDLMGNSTMAHIHVINGPGDANILDTLGPVATTTPSFVGFPAGVTSGAYDMTFDTLASGTYRGGFVTDSAALHPALTGVEAAELELFSAITSGRAYLNIHSTSFPPGEIRGFLVPIPEPASLHLALASIVALSAWGRRRRPGRCKA